MRAISKSKAVAISKVIEYQFPPSPEGRLMFSVVKQALMDSVDYSSDPSKEIDRLNAIRYLKGKMYHCEICGVSSEWVHRLINKAELPYSVNYK